MFMVDGLTTRTDQAYSDLPFEDRAILHSRVLHGVILSNSDRADRIIFANRMLARTPGAIKLPSGSRSPRFSFQTFIDCLALLRHRPFRKIILQVETSTMPTETEKGPRLSPRPLLFDHQPYLRPNWPPWLELASPYMAR